MSNLGMRILYRHHEQHGRRLVRACFRPLGRHGGGDARSASLPLYALESGDPDAAISTSSPFPSATRWRITHVLNMLRPGRRAAARGQRTELTPDGHRRAALRVSTRSRSRILLTSSPSARARRCTPELLELLPPGEARGLDASSSFSVPPAQIDGIYVPRVCYEVDYNADGTVAVDHAEGRRA